MLETGSMAEEVTFICCIESGGLEEMTVRMAASLRRFGGRFAHAPIIAVQPRRGVGVTPRTRQQLDEYDVALVRDVAANVYPWNQFFNKPAAMQVGNRLAKTPTVCWIDSDILVLAEPQLLSLDDEEDFVACPSDNCGSTTGPGDRNEAYWKLVIELAGLKLDDYPWLVNCQGNRVRTYFNSGLFVYRRDSAFMQHYPAACERLLMSGYKSPITGLFFTDQVMLGASAIAAGLRMRALPMEYNYPVGSQTEEPYSSARMARTVIMHYHAALFPEYWPTMLEQLRQDRPEVYEWLAPWGPISGQTHWPARIVRKVLKEYRRRKCERFAQRCEALEPSAAP